MEVGGGGWKCGALQNISFFVVAFVLGVHAFVMITPERKFQLFKGVAQSHLVDLFLCAGLCVPVSVL